MESMMDRPQTDVDGPDVELQEFSDDVINTPPSNDINRLEQDHMYLQLLGVMIDGPPAYGANSKRDLIAPLLIGFIIIAAYVNAAIILWG